MVNKKGQNFINISQVFDQKFRSDSIAMFCSCCFHIINIYNSKILIFTKLSEYYKQHTQKSKSNIDEKIFLCPPPPSRQKMVKKEAFFEFLTTRFILEKYFSNKTCG
jgi:hypothetical protein